MEPKSTSELKRMNTLDEQMLIDDTALAGRVSTLETNNSSINAQLLILNAAIYTHPTNHPPSIITQDVNNRFVTDAEKIAWNAKQAALGYVPVNVNDARLSDARTPLAHAHAISEVTGLQTTLDSKVDDNQVLTNVPAGAVFTDTKTFINGKTGTITKADIVALDIPAQDTVYTHPSNHAPSIITQDANNRFVTDAEKSVWNAKQPAIGYTPADTNDTRLSDARTPLAHEHEISEVIGLQTALEGKVDDSQVLTNVPVGALFTDTKTIINGKTGTVSKADIVALGIPAQDTVYTHPSNHAPSIITQDANNRFVTDAEKTTWNAKQAALGYAPVNKAGDTMTGGLHLKYLGGDRPASLITEANGQIIDFGVNFAQSGQRIAGQEGGFFRIDTRSWVPELFSVITQTSTGTEAFPMTVSKEGDVIARKFKQWVEGGSIELAQIDHVHDKADITDFPTLGTVAALNTGTGSGNIPILDGNGNLIHLFFLQ